MKRVKFNRSCAPYTTGEVAAFDDEKAEQLVDKGMANYLATEEKPNKTKKMKRRSLSRNRQVTTD